MVYCKFCSYNDATGFNQESELIKHIKSEHLQKFANKKEIIYRCCYGQNNSCEVMSNGKHCDFNSEMEYEKHLILNHLKKLADHKNSFDITDTEIIANSLNYDEVKNTLNSSKKWSYHHSKINLPAVLNDPQHRQLDIFSKTWGDTFEKSDFGLCQHLVPPDKSQFIPYIKKVRSSLKYRENMLKKINDQKSFYLNSDSTPPSSLKLSSPAENHSNSPDLELVPKIFFHSDFNLNSKDIFSSVIPIFLVPSSSSSSSSNTNNFTLLDNTLHNKFSALSGARLKNHKWISDDNAAGRMNEKLSYYLDIVEINIAKQVSKKSNSFFEAVSTQDQVRDKLTQALTQISNVRNKLSISDESLTKKHLKILLLLQRKKNMQLLLEKLKFVKAVHSAQTTIQTLLSSNDLCGALDLISETEAIIDSSLLFTLNPQVSAGESSEDSVLPITNTNHIRVNCLKHVKPQLQELRAFLHKMVKQEYVNIVSRQLKIEEDWNETSVKLEVDYQMVPSLLAMMRLSSSSLAQITTKSPQSTNSKTSTNPFESDTLPQTHSSNSSRSPDTNFHSFLQLYYNDAMEESKTIVRKRVLQAYYKANSVTTHINGHHAVNGSSNTSAGINTEDESVTSSNNSIAASSKFADQMRTLDFEDWLVMMSVIIDDMVQLVWNVKIGCYTMRETVHLYKTSGSSSQSLTQNHQEEPDKNDQLTYEELKILPYNVSESLVHRIIKLVSARSKNGFLEKLPANQFVQMVQLLKSGIGERLCGSVIEWLEDMKTHQQQQPQQQQDQFSDSCCVEDLRKLLSSCVTELMTRLVTRFHNDRREKLQLIMDNDLWKEADVPTQLQELATQITNKDTGMPHNTSQSTPSLNNAVQNPTTTSTVTSTNNKYLELDGARYTVAAAALLLFGMISDYCQFGSILNSCSFGHSSMTTQTSPFTQILPHLVSLLKLFNSRSYQLVLGAGARRVAELETISAHNLAIAARSLDLILALFPRIRNHFETLYNVKYDTCSTKTPKQSGINGADYNQNTVLTNTNAATINSAFEKLIDVQLTVKDHIDNIGGKLVSMLEERIVSRLSSWTGKPPAPSPEIRGVCQQLSRLHDAICGILTPTMERELLLNVHDGFKAHLRARVRSLNIATDNGPRHGIVQAELAFYLSQLTALCGLRAFQESFSDVWV